MPTSIGARSRRLAVALGAALIAGSFAIPAAAAVPQGIGPSAADLAKIVPVSGPRACVARHDGVSYSTLQAAVDAADPGESVTVQGTCAGFTFIDKDLTIRGVQTATSGKPTLTGQRRIPILAIDSVVPGGAARPSGEGPGYGVNVTIHGLRIIRGTAAELTAINLGNGGSLRLVDTIVAQNRGIHAGAIRARYDALLELHGTTEVRKNRNVDSVGGGIYMLDGSLLVMRDRSSIHHNRTFDAAGGGVRLNCASLEMHDDSSIHHNRAGNSHDGGGVYASGLDCFGDSGRIVLNDRASIHSNYATDDGGGISAGHVPVALNDAASIRVNTADTGAGLFLVDDASLALNDGSRISGNVAAQDGGGLYASNTTVFLNEAARIVGNAVAGDVGGGGGVTLFDSVMTLSGTSRISGNRTAGFGGGIRLAAADTLTFTGSAIVTGNTAGIDGGGVWAACSATVTGQTLGGNNTGNTPDDFFQETC